MFNQQYTNMTQVQQIVTDIMRKNYASHYTSGDVVLDRKEAQMMLEAMEQQRELCSKAYNCTNMILDSVTSKILNAGTGEVA